MTETAGPQGGPPPSAGRGPWSEAFEGERGGGGGGGGEGVNTAVSSDTRRAEAEFKSEHLIEHFVLQSQTRCNESECGETEMKAARRSLVLAVPSRIYHKEINYKCYLAVAVLINNEGVKQALHSEEIICSDCLFFLEVIFVFLLALGSLLFV